MAAKIFRNLGAVEFRFRDRALGFRGSGLGFEGLGFRVYLYIQREREREREREKARLHRGSFSGLPCRIQQNWLDKKRNYNGDYGQNAVYYTYNVAQSTAKRGFVNGAVGWVNDKPARFKGLGLRSLPMGP